MPVDPMKKLDDVGSSQSGKGSAYDNPKQDPKYKEKWAGPNIRVYKDAVYDRISELLLQKWTEIEPYIEGDDGILSLQKTYKDGKLIVGREATDLLVVYESDVEANADDAKVEGAILDWLDFIDVKMMTLSIVTTSELLEGGGPAPPNLILSAPDKVDFNLNEIIGTLELADINLKDNVSQFMSIDKVKTEINRSKFNEFIDTKFGELTPETFTHFLEMYISLKNRIPLRYRSDDFFKEYINSNLPIDYKIEKLFEEFETIKYEIEKGSLTGYDTFGNIIVAELTDKQLFGWETLTYLVAESQKIIGTKNPIFNQQDAGTWWNRISGLEEKKELLTINNKKLEGEVQRLLDIIANMTGSVDASVPGCADPIATNYNPAATMDDGSCTYAAAPPEEMVTITAIGTGGNNSSARIFTIKSSTGTTRRVYHQNSGRGLRMTVLTAESMIGGQWDGTKLYDKTYDVYSSDTKRQQMAEEILGGDWQMNDLFVITSHNSVKYNELLISALKTIGACYPRLESGIGDSNPNNNVKTPYVLVGSKALGECGGYEDIQDDGEYSAPAKIVKEWRPFLGTEGGWDTGAPPEAPVAPVPGCTDTTAINFNMLATQEDGSCTYAPTEGMVKGCTDSTATNYNENAEIDDGSCVYTPPPAFEEKFDDWDPSMNQYSPGPYWWRTHDIGNVVKTDGPDGAGDGGVRIYRTRATGTWPGALYNPPTTDPRKKGAWSVPEFDIENKKVQHLYLQEGRTYKISLWGRCNTTDKKAQFFIGDTRGGSPYVWQKSAAWNTNNNWTSTSRTFTPSKNTRTGNDFFKVEYWTYDGGASPEWANRHSPDNPADVQYHGSIPWEWGTKSVGGVANDNIMGEATGYVKIDTPGNYKFSIKHDDGAHLWVNGQHMISNWADGGARWTESGTIYLDKPAKIKTRFYENAGAASWRLAIKGPSDSAFKLASGFSDPNYPKYEGIMAQIYLYPGTTSGAAPGQYCDYANLKVEEISRSGGVLRSYNKGGAIKSSDNTGPIGEVNPDIRLPKMNLSFLDEVARENSVRLGKNVEMGTQNCKAERRMLASLSGLSLVEIQSTLRDYIKKNEPCLSTPVSYQSGGRDCCDTTCGDSNGDGILNVLDVVFMVNVVLGDSDDVPVCLDLNSDGLVNIQDVVMLVNGVLSGAVITTCNMCDDGSPECGGVIDCHGNPHYDICSVSELEDWERYDVCGNCSNNPQSSCSECCLSWDADESGGWTQCDFPPPDGVGSAQSNVCYHTGAYVDQGGGESGIFQMSVVGEPLDYPHCGFSIGDGCLAASFKGGGKVRGRTNPVVKR